MLTSNNYEHKIDEYGKYLNDICENDIPFNYNDYNKILKELEKIKMKSKPNSGVSLYIDYLFFYIKNSKINNKIRKFKLQKIMNYNAITNSN